MNTAQLQRRSRSVLTAACLLALAGAPALSQAEEIDIDGVVQTALAEVGDAMDAIDFDDASVAFASDEMGSERVVKGAPYCADAVHETVQTLADGNRIVRKQQTRLCRDGEGRTRQEVDRDGRKLVWLRDPVAKQGWLLDPQRKTARKLGHFGHAMWFNDAAIEAVHAEQWRAFADQARRQAVAMADQARVQAQQARAMQERMRGAAAQPAAAPAAVPAPQPVLIARPVEAAAAAADAAPAAGRPLEIQVLRLNDQNRPLLPPGQPGALTGLLPPPPPPVVRWQAQRFAPRGPGVLSALGSKDIEGVRANGERTTWTIEAGRIGNEKPIQIVREVWTSPELLLTVQSRDADPRRGETVYRLANLKRGEPDAGLMKVPADYAVSEAAALPAPPAMPHAPAAPGLRRPAAAGSTPKG